MLVHVGRVDLDRFAGAVRGGEGDLVEDAFHHRLQPAGADTLFSTLEFTATATSATASIESSENSSVTPSVAISAMYCLISDASGSVEDAPHVVAGQRFELDADRQPALQLGAAGRTASRCGRAPEAMKRIWSGLHRAVLGGDRGASSINGSRSRVVHALARDVGADHGLRGRRSCRSRRGTR